MQKIKFPGILSILGLFALLVTVSSVALSATDNQDWLYAAESNSPGLDLLMLAQSEKQLAEDEQPRSGSLVLPAAADEEKSEKKCMTVCQRWGQECMIDSSRGVRKCRRTCKEFGQECF
ncbi:MAG: hypothetical protein ACI9SC_002808 [Gammaproteobacteria bacterium]|jgi:hypothetical protein